MMQIVVDQKAFLKEKDNDKNKKEKSKKLSSKN
jgi:hypothetical protein